MNNNISNELCLLYEFLLLFFFKTDIMGYMYSGRKKVNYSVRKKNNGFTLIEIMIVIVIIAILATVITPQFTTLITKAKETQLIQNLGAMRDSINVQFTKNNGEYPSSITASMFKENTIPMDPIAKTNSVQLTDESPINVISTRGGWIYNGTSGEVRINSTNKDINGIEYCKY